jgi:hypothetical protein
MQQLDWPTAVGYLLGRAAAKLSKAGDFLSGFLKPRNQPP